MELTITYTTRTIGGVDVVQWAARHTPPEPIVFDVFRAGSSSGPWEPLAANLHDTWVYLDRALHEPAVPGAAAAAPATTYAMGRVRYYRVVALTQSRQKLGEAVSGLQLPRGPFAGLYATKLFELTQTLRSTNGVRLALLKRRFWGPRCPVCWDPATGDSLLGSCAHCFGTSFVGGYWHPFVEYGRRAPSPVQTVMTPEGYTDRQAPQFVLLPTVLAEQKDVLVELEGPARKRYEVEIVSFTEVHGNPLHQTLTATCLARGHIAYDVPVDFDAPCGEEPWQKLRTLASQQ